MAAVTTWPLAANKNVVWTPGFIIQQMSDDWISYYTERFHMCVLNVVPRHPDHLVQLHDHPPAQPGLYREGPALLLSVCPRMS